MRTKKNMSGEAKVKHDEKEKRRKIEDKQSKKRLKEWQTENRAKEENAKTVIRQLEGAQGQIHQEKEAPHPYIVKPKNSKIKNPDAQINKHIFEIN